MPVWFLGVLGVNRVHNKPVDVVCDCTTSKHDCYETIWVLLMPSTLRNHTGMMGGLQGLALLGIKIYQRFRLLKMHAPI